jgi:hypothetical protein
MGAREPSHVMLTLKGVEELSLRTYRLDAKLRNILFLIQKGTPTVEAILENSIFPHEEVIEKLRGLMKERFVELGAGSAPIGASSPPSTVAAGVRPGTFEIEADSQTVGGAPFERTAPPLFLTLDSDISMSQARFELCDFCLDQFGTKAQPLIDAIENAVDVTELQRALDGITAELREHFKDQLPALMSRVRDINETSI